MSAAASMIAGAILIFVTLRDVLHELFQPSGAGSISQSMSRGLWSTFRRISVHRPRILPLAGPLIVASVLTFWAILLILGWALLYWPWMPQSFHFADRIQASAGSDFIDAIYLSAVSLSTLGFGEITPETPVLRLVVGAQGLVGFGFLTAGISWILSITPVLSRRRAFAHFLALLAQPERGDHPVDDRDVLKPLLLSLTESMSRLRTDLINTPVAYYFHRMAGTDSLAAQLPGLYRRAQAMRESSAAPAPHAAMLCAAIDSFAAALTQRHLRCGSASTVEILRAYADDHRRGQGDHERA